MKYPSNLPLLWNWLLLCIFLNNLQAQNLSGSVFTPTDVPMADIKIQVNEGEGMLLTTTDQNGVFSFIPTPTDIGYKIMPFKEDDDPLNGVDMFDALLILKHILRITTMESPYQRIAADVNGSGTITTMDIIKLRRMILRIDESFDNINSWRFVDANFDFEGLTLAHIPDFEEFRFLEAIVAGQSTIDFVGIKTGDVNFTANTDNFVFADERNKEKLNLVVKDHWNEVQQTITLSFQSNNFQDIAALQFSLHFNAEIADLVQLEAKALPQLKAENIGKNLLDQGLLSFGWLSVEGVSSEDSDALFELSFRTSNPRALLQSLRLSSDVTKALAFQSDGTSMGVGLQIENQNISSNDINLNSFPNPFSRETNISFTLPKEAIATLEILDSNGKTLKSIQKQWSLGYHEVALKAEDLVTTSGLIFIKWTSKEKTLIKKCLKLKVDR